MSKSKKFKTIQDHVGLKTGRTYIRAVINCHGKYWLEIFTVVKKPTLQNTKHMGKNWMFDIKPVHQVYSKLRNRVDPNRFVSTYTDHRNFHAVNSETGTVTVVLDGSLFLFSNRVLNFLKNNMSDVKQFLQAINPNIVITGEIMRQFQEDFDFMIYMDQETSKEYMAA